MGLSTLAEARGKEELFTAWWPGGKAGEEETVLASGQTASHLQAKLLASVKAHAKALTHSHPLTSPLCPHSTTGLFARPSAYGPLGTVKVSPLRCSHYPCPVKSVSVSKSILQSHGL